MGSYTHIANSIHIYETHFALVDEMLKYDFTKDGLPLLDCDMIDENGNEIKNKTGEFINFIENKLN